jgi:arsenate reductase-like glutaredoxin family protein
MNCIKLPMKEIIEKYQKGYTKEDLGRVYKASSTTIGNKLKKENIRIRNLSEALNYGKEFPVQEIVNLYKNGWSKEKLCKEYGIEDRKVKHILNNNGIRIRSLSEQMLFGKEDFNIKEIIDESKKIIRQIGYLPGWHKLKKSGYSEIANVIYRKIGFKKLRKILKLKIRESWPKEKTYEIAKKIIDKEGYLPSKRELLESSNPAYIKLGQKIGHFIGVKELRKELDASPCRKIHYRIRKMEKQILNKLRNSYDNLTEISHSIGINKNTLKRVMNKLIKEGKLDQGYERNRHRILQKQIDVIIDYASKTKENGKYYSPNEIGKIVKLSSETIRNIIDKTIDKGILDEKYRRHHNRIPDYLGSRSLERVVDLYIRK